MSSVVAPSREVAPLRLPTLPAAEAQRFNVLAATGRSFTFAWAGAPATLRFTAAADAGHTTRYLRVQLDDHTLDLGLSTLPEPARLGVDFAGIELAHLPDELRLGVLETCCEDALAALRTHGVDLEFISWLTAAEPGPAAFGWEIALQGEPFLAGTLNADPAALDHLADLAHRIAPAPIRTAATLPVPVQVVLTHLTLPLQTLRQLAPGDVLLPALTAAHWATGTCELWSGHRRLGTAVRTGSSVKIQAMKQTPDAPSPAAASGPLRVDELPVPVVCDVGQLELTVGQLRTLGAGHTLELPAVPGRAVTLRANGREIGQGELVDLGEKLGVRITTWSLA